MRRAWPVLLVCLALALSEGATLGKLLQGGSYGNLSLWLFLGGFLVSLWRPRVGLQLMIFLLPFVPALHRQLQAVFGLPAAALQHPGLDLALGFSLATALRLRSEAAPPGWQSRWIPTAALAFIGVSTAVAIGRNLWQSASVFSVKGLLFNVLLLRDLNWHDDYFPLSDLFSYSTAFAVLILTISLLRREKAPRELVVRPLFVSSILGALFAFAQVVWRFGYFRDPLERGVNGFFPDLHAFAGAMLVPAFGGVAYAATSRGRDRMLGIIAALTGFLGVFLSGSKFSLAALLMAVALWLLIRVGRFSKRTALALFGAVAIVALATWGFVAKGYGGLQAETVRHFLEAPSFEAFNELLSYRPELFLAALRMFESYPLFGLGQGEFNRTSPIRAFAGSAYFERAGGENAHNYFLQTLAELGVIGFVLLALIFVVPLVRSGAWRRARFSVVALGALFLGNVFAHSLLVREMLVLGAVLTALLYAETGAASEPLSPRMRIPPLLTLLGGALIASVAAAEVVHSFDKLPFLYGLKCYDPGSLSSDHWTSGLYRVPIPPGSTAADLVFDHGHADAGRRPLGITFTAENSHNEALSATQRTYQWELGDRLTVPLPAGAASFAIRTSRCFVPRNLGVADDPRQLGIKLQKLDFTK